MFIHEHLATNTLGIGWTEPRQECECTVWRLLHQLTVSRWFWCLCQILMWASHSTWYDKVIRCVCAEKLARSGLWQHATATPLGQNTLTRHTVWKSLQSWSASCVAAAETVGWGWKESIVAHSVFGVHYIFAYLSVWTHSCTENN